MEDGKHQTQGGELLLSTSGMKPDEAADHGCGRGEEGREEAEEMNHKREGADQSIDSGGKGRVEEIGGGQCGGIINHLITNLIPGSSVGEHGEQRKQEEDSCGLINQLISSLPINPDDETPAADEASLLISIIED